MSVLAAPPPRRRAALLGVTVVAVATLVVHALAAGGHPTTAGNLLCISIQIGAVIACGARAALVRSQRLAWACIAAALACWTIGDVVWYALDVTARSTSPADAFYLAYFPLCCAGLALLLADGRDRLAVPLWVDGLIGGLSAAAWAVALAFATIERASDGTPAQVAVALTYPLGDLVLICFVVTAFATQAWRPGRGWALLGIGLLLGALGDTLYLWAAARGEPLAHVALVNALWPATTACCGWAAWQPWRPRRAEHAYGGQTIAIPALFAFGALALLVWDHWMRVDRVAVVLATLALVVAIARAAWTFREHTRLLRASRAEALTDGLTGIANRRSLLLDLERVARRRPPPGEHTLVLFDLDGFKGYNDGFGHGAGDMLLCRLAARLAAATADHGRAYRLGGDEFCVLLDGAREGEDPLVLACADALSEQGEGFHVTASRGVVAIPGEAATAKQALQLADQRMYAAKHRVHASSRRQASDVLLQALREREPALHDHLHGVAGLAVAVARTLGLTAEQVDEIARAAELHDIGKLAIPDEILHKPGPLDPDEWALMRQHTVVGARILAAAPAMRPVALVVRSSHERFDGGGYPDGLAGEQIPIGARVIAVCDAYDAMVSRRAYKAPLAPAAALAELRRCAGSQFDPAVVAAFGAVLARGVPRSAPTAAP